MYPCVINSLMAARIPSAQARGHHAVNRGADPGAQTRRTIASDPSEKFVTEGVAEVGPKEDYFAFVEGECLGALLRRHLGVGSERGYTSLGRMRVTVERTKAPDPSWETYGRGA
jgi:hypothetical protein